MIRSFRQSSMMLTLCLLCCSCAGTRPVVYSDIASSSYLRPNSGARAARIPYAYATQTDWRTYRHVMLDPVTIYRGSDHQFGTMPEEHKRRLADYMHRQFSQALGTLFAPASRPSPDTIRVRLTLIGAKTNTPVLSTVSHFDLAGGTYNAVQAVRGREGAMTGWVIYAVEIHDAANDRLLKAYVSKQYPAALNIRASVGGMTAPMTGIRKGADDLVAQLGRTGPAS